MRIRALGPDDAPACVAASTAVGWDSDEPRWRRMLLLGEAFGAEAKGGTLAGTVILTRFGDALATIAMMVVAPAFQRQGIGGRLMEAATSRAGDGALYLFATEEGRGLYEKLGFVDDQTQSERFEGRATLGRAFDVVAGRRTGAGLEVRAMRGADVPAVLALDAEAQGAPRSALLEALLCDAERALVVPGDGEIRGFGMATLAGKVRLLAPLVARDDETARALASALAAGADAIRLDLEPGEKALREWAREAGLAQTGANTRMVRGGRALPGRRGLVRGMCGRAYG
jgi:ribosomal protein S18 acetylase RimI-like enzyme